MESAGAVARRARQVQMNTRIDEELKELGDTALHRLGYTPSAAVRGLWRFVVDHEDNPADVHAVLGGKESGANEKRIHTLAMQRERYAACLAELGIKPGVRKDLPSWDDLRDEWYEERLARDGDA